MGDLILKRRDIIKQNLERGYFASVFAGSMQANNDASTPQYCKDANGVDMNYIVDTEKANWVGTKEYTQHWNTIKTTLDKIRDDKLKQNTAQFPADYYTLIDALSLDLTKRRIQEVDFTPLLTQEQVNLEFSKSVNLKEFLGFVGEFQENNLAGDSVPLIEQKTGAKGSVEMVGYALGHVRSLEDILYNLDIYSIQKVNEAYIRAFIGKRNDLVWARMIELSTSGGDEWDSSQTVAADATSGTSLEEKVYITMNNAITALGKLYDFQTNQEIVMPKIVFATGRNVDARLVERAIRGQLNNSKGLTANRESLEVDELWMYKGDSFTYGKKKVTYGGIAASKGYLFIPGPSGAPTHTLVKRPLTTVTSPGDAANLSQEKEAKYFIQTAYTDEWYGTSAGNTVIDANTDHDWGYVVEVNLPSA